MLDRLGLAWEVGMASGWGVYGLHLALEAARRGLDPVPFGLVREPPVNALQAPLLARPRANQARAKRFLGLHGATTFPYPVLQALGNDLQSAAAVLGAHGTPDIGVVFLEQGALDAESVERGRQYPCIVAGSTWNGEVLRAHGLDNVAVCLQGVDRTVFHPAPAANPYPGRFLVFSGGKFEFRKGQDIVAAAFRRFRETHPDALLVVNWHNWWEQSVATMRRSPHVADVPAVGPDRRLHAEAWLAEQGIPPEAVLDLGVVPNDRMGAILREMDVAVFPNRCEGGTNLVAMEAMACGVPAIVSANSGHLDLTATGAPWALEDQRPVGDAPGYRGWGESAVDEVVACLEAAYDDAAAARARGAAGAAALAEWGWDRRIHHLLSLVEEVTG